MRTVEDWFDEISNNVMNFRDSVSKKLNEVKMSLQRPQLPMIGLGPGLTHPYSFDELGRKSDKYLSEYKNKLALKAKKDVGAN